MQPEGKRIGTTPLGAILQNLIKFRIGIINNPAILLLNLCPREGLPCAHKEGGTQMFTKALLVTANNKANRKSKIQQEGNGWIMTYSHSEISHGN